VCTPYKIAAQTSMYVQRRNTPDRASTHRAPVAAGIMLIQVNGSYRSHVGGCGTFSRDRRPFRPDTDGKVIATSPAVFPKATRRTP
jgi:hypothetical protein